MFDQGEKQSDLYLREPHTRDLLSCQIQALLTAPGCSQVFVPCSMGLLRKSNTIYTKLKRKTIVFSATSVLVRGMEFMRKRHTGRPKILLQTSLNSTFFFPHTRCFTSVYVCIHAPVHLVKARLQYCSSSSLSSCHCSDFLNPSNRISHDDMQVKCRPHGQQLPPC